RARGVAGHAQPALVSADISRGRRASGPLRLGRTCACGARTRACQLVCRSRGPPRPPGGDPGGCARGAGSGTPRPPVTPADGLARAASVPVSASGFAEAAGRLARREGTPVSARGAPGAGSPGCECPPATACGHRLLLDFAPGGPRSRVIHPGGSIRDAAWSLSGPDGRVPPVMTVAGPGVWRGDEAMRVDEESPDDGSGCW